jgi:hypothetical protein
VLYGARVWLCLAALALITGLNLWGVSESAKVFTVPTLLLILAMAAVIVGGLARSHPAVPLNRSLGPPTEAVGLLLLLKAFASGCSALTGVEAIAIGDEAVAVRVCFADPEDQYQSLVTLIPEVQPKRFWDYVLFNQRGAILDRAVRHGTANVVMCRLRYRLDHFAPHDAGSAPSPDAAPAPEAAAPEADPAATTADPSPSPDH